MRIVPGEGPVPCDLAIVGEAPGDNENLYLRPFIGTAGDELTRMLADAGLNRSNVYVTNVFKTQPPDNKVDFFFTSRTDPDACTDYPSYLGGKYLRTSYRSFLDQLFVELDGVGAKVVIALGNTALWALLGRTKISAFVGTVHEPTDDRPYYVVPTYHPAAVVRMWSLRTTVIANFRKVVETLETARRLPTRRTGTSSPGQRKFNIKINPTLAEVQAFTAKVITAPEIAIDVETKFGQIRTISFTHRANNAFVIPFWEPPDNSYWSSVASEVEAWKCVARICACPAVKIFHNGAYDIQYLWRAHGIRLQGPIADTMLAHHAMEPELPKSLGHLSATYLNIPEWKTMRNITEKDEE